MTGPAMGVRAHPYSTELTDLNIVTTIEMFGAKSHHPGDDIGHGAPTGRRRLIPIRIT